MSYMSSQHEKKSEKYDKYKNKLKNNPHKEDKDKFKQEEIKYYRRLKEQQKREEAYRNYIYDRYGNHEGEDYN